MPDMNSTCWFVHSPCWLWGSRIPMIAAYWFATSAFASVAFCRKSSRSAIDGTPWFALFLIPCFHPRFRSCSYCSSLLIPMISHDFPIWFTMVSLIFTWCPSWFRGFTSFSEKRRCSKRRRRIWHTPRQRRKRWWDSWGSSRGSCYGSYGWLMGLPFGKLTVCYGKWP